MLWMTTSKYLGSYLYHVDDGHTVQHDRQHASPPQTFGYTHLGLSWKGTCPLVMILLTLSFAGNLGKPQVPAVGSPSAVATRYRFVSCPSDPY